MKRRPNDPSIRLADLHCNLCGSHEVTAIAPGEPEKREAEILLRRAVPLRAWCHPCWATSFASKAAS